MQQAAITIRHLTLTWLDAGVTLFEENDFGNEENEIHGNRHRH